MRVAFFNRAFYPEISATSQLLTELAQGLAQDHGCCVTVISGMPLGEREPSWSAPKNHGLLRPDSLGQVQILRAWGTTFSKRTLLGRIINYLTYFASACLAAVRIDRPEVVIALTDPPIVGLAALLACIRFHCPLVISYRDLFPEVTRLLDGKRRPFIEPILHGVNRILIRYSKRIIALGEDMRNRLIHEKGARPDQVVLIPDWADTTQIVPGPKENPFSVAHALNHSFVVMHSGNMGASQNLGTLVDALTFLTDLLDLLLVFVGDGVKKLDLEEQAQRLGLKNVHFLPYQPKERLTQTFSAADCFIISLKPGLAGYITPSKLYGILAAGRPYVAAIDPGCDVARITQQYESGLLAQPANPKNLAKGIRMLYNDPVLRTRLGANARKAAEHFTRSKGVGAYYGLCCELVKTAPHRR